MTKTLEEKPYMEKKDDKKDKKKKLIFGTTTQDEVEKSLEDYQKRKLLEYK